MFEEVTGTLFTGDLFTHLGNGEPLIRESLVPAAMAARRSARERVRNIEKIQGVPFDIAGAGDRRHHPAACGAQAEAAVMHGSCFEGSEARESVAEPNALADYYERALSAALKAA